MSKLGCYDLDGWMTKWIKTWLGGGSPPAYHKWSIRSLSGDVACLTSLSVSWGGGGLCSHQVCRCHQTGGGMPINTLRGWAAREGDPARLEEGAARDLMKIQ